MKIILSHHFKNITENLESDLLKLIQYNIDHKLDSYLQGGSDDKECRMDIIIEKNKKTLYEGSLNVNMDGKIYNFRVDSSTPFKSPEDAVSHLFTHFKEKMSKQHQK